LCLLHDNGADATLLLCQLTISAMVATIAVPFSNVKPPVWACTFE
jgi:hypothetical protein